MTNLLPPPLAASAFIVAKDLTLGLLAIGRGDLDLLDAVVAVSIVQSNVARVHADAEKDRRYEGGETLPPEESRQPVSVKAVANMLGLPFETVRRRIERLCARGVCARRRAGVVVPTTWLDSPAHRAAIAATEELVPDDLSAAAGGGLLRLRPAAQGGAGECAASTPGQPGGLGLFPAQRRGDDRRAS